MKISEQSARQIKEAIAKAIATYSSDEEEPTNVTDIYLLVNQESGELVISNDDEKELGKTTIEEMANWISKGMNIEKMLTTVLSEMKKAGCFDKLNIIKPYSFVLIDDNKETIADLLLMDDDTLIFNDDLLKGLDDELNDFLKTLLEK